LEILDASNEFLEEHVDVRVRIQDSIWVLRSLLDLIPQTVENLWSGHVFPITEAEYELESSIVLRKLGFYKHAIGSLRNVFEMGLLSVYWDIEDKSHVEIQGWLKSMESTPFRREIFKHLKTNTNIKTFDDRQSFFDRTAKLYEKLCDFSHTKGYRYSSRKLNNHSNVNHFTAASFSNWLEIMTKVVEAVTIFHVLKYPVGLQETRIDDKFGLNGPAGGFLNPDQVERIRKVVSKDLLTDLQDISDNDPSAVSMAAWVSGQPDLTPEQFEEQVEKEDQRSIAMEGFEHWFKNQKKLYRTQRSDADVWRHQLARWKKMRSWARDNECLTKGTKDYWGNDLVL